MKRNLIKIIIFIFLVAVIFVAVLYCAARFVMLSPSCYSNNKLLTEQENDLIKNLVLESVEARLSIFAHGNESMYDSSAAEIEIIQLEKEQHNRKHVFVFIDRDFMDTVQRDDDSYIIRVQTYGMERGSSDCVYEIHISKDFSITFFGLDP